MHSNIYNELKTRAARRASLKLNHVLNIIALSLLSTFLIIYATWEIMRTI